MKALYSWRLQFATVVILTSHDLTTVSLVKKTNTNGLSLSAETNLTFSIDKTQFTIV